MSSTAQVLHMAGERSLGFEEIGLGGGLCRHGKIFLDP